jgi:hypothetical protein|eukprot:jgi/Chrpa1/5343/Chrysochromulina_OHIO_Genome00017227-RA
MRVIAATETVLSNFEVKRLLERQQQEQLREEEALPLPGARRGEAAGSTAWQSRQQAALISEQVLTYLGGTCCAAETEKRLAAFLTAVAPFKLMQGEILSLINIQPRSRAVISTLVEEYEERLTEEQTFQLLQLCQQLTQDESVISEEPSGRTSRN